MLMEILFKTIKQYFQNIFPSHSYIMYVCTPRELDFCSIYIGRNMIVVTVLNLDINQMEFPLVQKYNCRDADDHILFNLKGIRNVFLWVQPSPRPEQISS